MCVPSSRRASKNEICRVQPGVRLVRASDLRPMRVLSRLLLPTFDRPAKAISTPTGGGIWLGAEALAT
jgi:hypothetical protein